MQMFRTHRGIHASERQGRDGDRRLRRDRHAHRPYVRLHDRLQKGPVADVQIPHDSELRPRVLGAELRGRALDEASDLRRIDGEMGCDGPDGHRRIELRPPHHDVAERRHGRGCDELPIRGPSYRPCGPERIPHEQEPDQVRTEP